MLASTSLTTVYNAPSQWIEHLKLVQVRHQIFLQPSKMSWAELYNL
jgi:hypothetical protein